LDQADGHQSMAPDRKYFEDYGVTLVTSRPIDCEWDSSP